MDLQAFKQSFTNSQKLKKLLSILILCFLDVCKAGNVSIVLLLKIRCRWCGVIFCICRSCWRGQAYCSDECGIAGRCQAHREAQRRYRQTQRGKYTHSRAERRRRIRIFKRSVDDGSSTPQYRGYKIQSSIKQSCIMDSHFHFKVKGERGHCHFCGVSGLIVEKFPRRGYGKYTLREKKSPL